MFPAAAFAGEMRQRGWAVGLISDSRGLAYAEGFPADWTQQVAAASPRLRQPWTLPATWLKLRAGVATARHRFGETRPDLVAGFGGYPAYPALSAARALRIPLLIHEQNAVLGRVNRAFAAAATHVASGFDRLDRLPRAARHVALGNPVRPAVIAAAGRALPDTDGTLTVFVTGGSQGARILGEAVPEAIMAHVPAALQARLRLVQQVRAEQIDAVSARYAAAGIQAELAPFFDDMPARLAGAHLVIARSGAGTVSEISAIGRPSILIPLKIAMDNHQLANADGLVRAGAADLLLEDEVTPARLGAQIARRLADGPGLRAMARAAADAGTLRAAADLADLAEQAAGRQVTSRTATL
jgi:UDP-N-acetylglucosamine--N-acetylmuramyl-(pentapeptide) pyrophosphoryl-undecaprenol N-acetylglucosamine transferase